MSRIQELTLMHLAFLALFAGCLASAQHFELPAFYFLEGLLCVPVFGTLFELYKAIRLHIKNS